jgi:hypothetical protein
MAQKKLRRPCEGIDVHARGQRRLHVFTTVGQGEGEFKCLGRPGFLHVVAGDRDRVELRHVLRRVADDVGNDAHRGLGRVDVGIANHELLEDIVLDRPRKQFLRHALFFRRHHVTGEDGQHRTVHGHRDRDLVQRNAVEQDLHVLHRVDRHAGLADVTRHPRVIRVVAAMGGEVESHRNTLAAGGQRLSVKRIGGLGRGEARVLADGPGANRIHGGLWPAQEGSESRQGIGVGQALDVGFGIERLDGQTFRRHPVEAGNIAVRGGLGSRLVPGFDRGNAHFGCLAHGFRPLATMRLTSRRRDMILHS